MSEYVYKIPKSLSTTTMHYCPGCGHGILHKLIAQAIDELAIEQKVIGIAPVGCAVLAYNYFNIDFAEAAHGRAPAVATGLKRVLKDKALVFTYQGDGDLAAIGTCEIVHAAARGENICVFFVNNAIYGMTGGQMAPTTLPGQVTATTPLGRDTSVAGFPLRVCEMLSVLDAPVYIERTSVAHPKYLPKLLQSIKKVFEYQMQNKGFCLIEVLSMCPTNWGLSPIDATKFCEEKMKSYYKLGVFVDKG